MNRLTLACQSNNETGEWVVVRKDRAGRCGRCVRSGGSVRTGRKTRAQQRDATRARIIEAAARTFSERGFRAASTREIAARAQVNQGADHLPLSEQPGALEGGSRPHVRSTAAQPRRIAHGRRVSGHPFTGARNDPAVRAFRGRPSGVLPAHGRGRQARRRPLALARRHALEADLRGIRASRPTLQSRLRRRADTVPLLHARRRGLGDLRTARGVPPLDPPRPCRTEERSRTTRSSSLGC